MKLRGDYDPEYNLSVDLEIVAERHRQTAKWGVQNHSPEKWVTILMEEVGEFAQAALQQRGDDARKELIQVAAVVLSMLESGDRNGWLVGA